MNRFWGVPLKDATSWMVGGRSMSHSLQANRLAVLARLARFRASASPGRGLGASKSSTWPIRKPVGPKRFKGCPPQSLSQRNVSTRKALAWTKTCGRLRVSCARRNLENSCAVCVVNLPLTGFQVQQKGPLFTINHAALPLCRLRTKLKSNSGIATRPRKDGPVEVPFSLQTIWQKGFL